MKSLLMTALIAGAHGLALVATPPIRLYVTAVGMVFPVDADKFPTYVDED